MILDPLPCPFCGKMPVIKPLYPDLDGDTWGAVQCSNVNCVARPIVLDGEEFADTRGSDEYKQRAIKRWNTRSIR